MSGVGDYPEAIEAAAKAMAATGFADEWETSTWREVWREAWRETARAGLAAALPYLPTTTNDEAKAPKDLLDALGIDPESPAVKAIEARMHATFEAIREAERRAAAQPDYLIGGAS